MAIHVFATFVTHEAPAANNRAETEGYMTTLQKILWRGEVHTTVSAEAIRFALRRRLAEHEACNRTFDEDQRINRWEDPRFERDYIDDDLLGFMSAEAAKEEGGKGTARTRRAVLEVTRAVSLTPWSGDVTFNAASPMATPAAQKKGERNPVPYATEVHATRYQYSIALTPDRLRNPQRASIALQCLCALGPVAGNHARFLFDFSPEAVVFRITQDPAPRILYCFELADGGRLSAAELLRKVPAGDIAADELIFGGLITSSLTDAERKTLQGAAFEKGVLNACSRAIERLGQDGKSQKRKPR